MSDLILWRKLHKGLPVAAEALRELAGEPVEVRRPLLGLLREPLTHPDPQVRAAAVQVLGGATGTATWARLVAALDDPEPAVRAAAVAALARSANRGDDRRFAHALFHRHPEVRRQALDAAFWPLPRWHALFLLPDPACRDGVEAILDGNHLGAEGLTVLADLHRRRLAPADELRPYLHRATGLDWAQFLTATAPADADRYALLLGTWARPDAVDALAVADPDPMAEAIDLLWHGDGRPGFDTLLPVGPTYGPVVRGRLVFRMLRRRLTGGDWPDAAAQMCAALDPTTLLCPLLPPDVARRAAAGLARGARPLPRFASLPFVAQVLESAVCRDPAGRVDLAAVAGVMRLTPAAAYDLVLKFVPRDALVAALRDALPLAPVLFCHRGEAARDILFRLVHDALDPVDQLALGARVNQRHYLDDLVDLDGATALAVARRLLGLSRLPGWRFPPSKAQRVAWQLIPQLGTAEIVELLGDLDDEAIEATGPLLVAFVYVLACERASIMIDALAGLGPDAVRPPILAIEVSRDFPTAVALRLAQRLRDRADDLARAWAEMTLRRLDPADTDEEPVELPRTDPGAAWDAILGHGALPPAQVAVAELEKPDSPFHAEALDVLLGGAEETRETLSALTKFLEHGPRVPREQRLRAAQRLWSVGRYGAAFPVLLQADPPAEDEAPQPPDLFAPILPEWVRAAVAGTLAAAADANAEMALNGWLDNTGVDEPTKHECLARVLSEASSPAARRKARELLRPSRGRDFKLLRLATTFAWGVRLGPFLTGRPFKIEMIANPEQLGYTRLTKPVLYITPLPLLRGEMFGREVVRGLIMHEYGHHLYHTGPGAQEVWKEGDETGLGRLLNLVSDEHLERNLRRRSRRYGDDLKLLNAYAFQHRTREVPVDRLLAALRGLALPVLSTTVLGAARSHGCVRVHNGRLLRELEARGHSLSRFIRALRMGLGNRYDDPKVAEALALFRGRFIDSDMPRLLEISRRLREIFGDECDLLDIAGQDASLGADDAEWVESSDGITEEEVQKEVESRLADSNGERGSGRPGRGLNLGPEEDFNHITTVERKEHDPVAHAELARQVQRPARQLRQSFSDLGLGFQADRRRTRGRRLDRAALATGLVKGDPRLLVARTPIRRTDLFIGVLVDCSGSMSGDNIRKARLFGTLLAEAARGQRGVDLRVFGFTDRVIYDAGDAARCAAHALEAGGGNNDAAGLWHAAQAADRSGRRAKLLVMISDGSPTECTVAALRGLVAKLTRRGVCCAQVAVQAIDEVCFPNYVLLEQDRVDECVRQFGAVVARLVGKALGGG